jgi:large subunit ribosomal protein L31e
LSQELERVYTINLGKVKLSQSQHRAVRAINMIREFARHHMKVETIKIEEELAQQIWSKGVRSPPRKVRVRMTKTDEGFILVSRYDEEVESKAVTESKSEKVVDEVEAPKTPEPAKEVEAPKTPEPAKEVEAPKTPEPAKEVEESSKEKPKKE